MTNSAPRPGLNRSDAKATATWQPPVANTGLRDLYSLQNPAAYAPNAQGRSAPEVVIEKTNNPDYVYWRVTHYDGRGGLNRQRGKFRDVHDRQKYNSLDTRFLEHCILPPLRTTAADPAPAFRTVFGIDIARIAYANFNGTLVIATNGNTVGDKVLFTEDSDGVISDTTYDPGFASSYGINGIWPIVIDGEDDAERLAVGKRTGVAEVLSDVGAPPTSYSAMHANTANCTGMIQVSLPGRAILMHCGNSLYSLTAASAPTAAPTLITSAVPAATFNSALGELSLGGDPRAYWFVNGRVYSTTLAGFGWQEERMPLKTYTGAVIVRDGIAVGDGTSIAWTNGRVKKNLRHLADRENDSDYTLTILGAWVKDRSELYVGMLLYPKDLSGTAYHWIEQYDWDLDTWQNASGVLSATYSINGTPTSSVGFPVSDTTGFLHAIIVDSWRRVKAPDPLVNPYFYRKSEDAELEGYADEFEASGELDIPPYTLPGLEGWEYVVKRISGAPDVPSGATVTVAVGGVDAVFTNRDTSLDNQRGRQMFPHWSNRNVVYELAPVITLARGTTGTDATRFTPQAFPITIEGLARRPRWAATGDFADANR